MLLRSCLYRKFLKTTASITFSHSIFLAYSLDQQLQKQPQIQRTEVSINHVLIYFEKVRLSVTLLDLE